MKVEIDRTGLQSVRIMLNGLKQQAPRIISRAINSTATKGRTEGGKLIRKQANLSAAYVRERLKIKKANFTNLQARIQTPNRGLLMSYYLYGVTGINQDTGRATQGALLKYKKGYHSVANLDQPLKVKINPNKPPVKLGPEWFILPKLKNSNLPGLARRVNGKLKLHGPSISQIFDDVVVELQEPMGEYMAEQVDKQIETALRGF